MPQENNQARSRVVQIIFLAVFLVITGQLLHLQLFSNTFRLQAESNAIYRKVMYPDRGIIFDRKGKAILENAIMYDLVITPAEARHGMDTMTLCKILDIDTAEYHKRVLTAIIKNGYYKSSTFEALLSPEKYAHLNESLYKFPGFLLQERSVRTYPFPVAANVLGRLGEVDSSFLAKHDGEGYQSGDFTGVTGLENTYERVLMGRRGVKRYLRDNHGRIQGSWEKGEYDTSAIAGRNIHSTIDIELQQLGEKLFQHKIGAAVAINPKTGGILAMISAPTFDPNLLSPANRRKNYGRLILDTARPMWNRGIQGQYPPGSTFKPLNALVALDEGLITPNFGVQCYGGYSGCGRYIRCTESWAGHAANLRTALAQSCNSYFSITYRMEVDNPKYGNVKKGYMAWKKYMNNFGLGVKLGVDLPSEQKGNIPDTSGYNKDFNGHWNSCSNVTLGIGQDRMTVTPLQLANEASLLANGGYYYVPHFVENIENENDEDREQLKPYRTKHKVLNISSTAFDAVHAGMADVATEGTAARISIPGIKFAAKTGTAQNPHGKNHAVFIAYAPVNNPRIAIAVVVENSGYGATWAGPIAGMMMEKYLNDTLTANSKAEAEHFSEINLIPDAIKHWYVVKDSLKQVRLINQANKGVDSLPPANLFKPQEAPKTEFDPEAEPNRKEDDSKLPNNIQIFNLPADTKNHFPYQNNSNTLPNYFLIPDNRYFIKDKYNWYIQ
ncbi:penicillin-binding protein 2 [Rhizosphaericola mali]|uniref:Penicillin-binding protein 2 n=1 Tax=Rhizosphaericola mali TaxID=2545455 RepID=A0A5P2G3W2_9BACT|nr:penicillin-binding protein 2 [Rhizosphaericola mali]QES89897.1 penicillin-binding protein 2 [Rhizosphaericola mali]